MRIHLKTSSNTEKVPFTYPTALVGALHKWLGQNELHHSISLYSLSWLVGSKSVKGGLDFPQGSSFFISCPTQEFIQQVMRGVLDDPKIRYGMQVTDVHIQETPDFGEQYTFSLQSPVLIKRSTADKQIKYYLPDDAESDQFLTETLQHKLHKAGMGDLEVQVAFDRTYQNIKTKLVDYKGTLNRATYCPITITGDSEALAFAWEVGVGNSTGIGFGSLK
jgi:CRISPR-associated endoribonuclease Cas6